MHSIMFKFALDTYGKVQIEMPENVGIFGKDDDAASKVAGHEVISRYIL